jgi:hypothetical protein
MKVRKRNKGTTDTFGGATTDGIECRHPMIDTQHASIGVAMAAVLLLLLLCK